ncbi:hypothetical protein TorRG33x02_058370 [Trema orientale]|uniref:Uncharacterized protein n=1 Tax=Trema orientale TaxID=63057 RepID=A0A2P5FKD4_TREOI|nr:hypothetical protein TorRG33x02_058370 [Trema orientale]
MTDLTFSTISLGHCNESLATPISPNSTNWQPFRWILIVIYFFFREVRSSIGTTKFRSFCSIITKSVSEEL